MTAQVPTYAQGGPRSVPVEEFLRALEKWFRDGGFSDVEIDIVAPDTDDMADIPEIEAVVNFRPESGKVAALEILVCGGAGPIAIGINIDSWKRLESRADLPIKRRRRKPYIAIFCQPLRTLTPSTAIQICRAVSDGNIDLRIVIMAGAIVGCWGGVPVSGSDEIWTGVGMGRSVAWLLDKLSLAQTVRVEYEPWPCHSRQHPASLKKPRAGLP